MRASIDGTPCRFLADCMRSEPHTNCRRRRFKRLSRLSSMPLPTARSQLGDGLCGFSDRSAHLTMSRYYNASLQPTATLVRGSRFGKRPSRRSRPSAKESKIPKSRGLRYRRSQVVLSGLQVALCSVLLIRPPGQCPLPVCAEFHSPWLRTKRIPRR